MSGRLGLVIELRQTARLKLAGGLGFRELFDGEGRGHFGIIILN